MMSTCKATRGIILSPSEKCKSHVIILSAISKVQGANMTALTEIIIDGVKIWR
ncbi:MAG: hypothetical protein II877_10535 [Synergistaceae bacterium]|nr:hypothetical protein [Synergistaceae bacterium]